jgi:hypothetical protein
VFHQTKKPTTHVSIVNTVADGLRRAAQQLENTLDYQECGVPTINISHEGKKIIVNIYMVAVGGGAHIGEQKNIYDRG